MTKRKVRAPFWSAISLLSLTAQRAPDGPVLAVMVSPSDFVVLAFVAFNPAKRGASEVEGITSVFSSHAHKVVGQGDSMGGAIALAEQYVNAWLESDAKADELCQCKEI